MRHNDISNAIIDTSIDIHRRLGPGLLESVYATVLAHELTKKGFRVAKEAAVPVRWGELTLDEGFRADLIVEDAVIVELKSVEKTSPVHRKQLLTYLRLADKRLGLLINFGEETLINGISRLVNGLKE